MCDAFKVFSCLPQGVVGGCRGCKFLKKSLNLIVFESMDVLFEVLRCGISSLLFSGVLKCCQLRSNLHFAASCC
jgi:hypothetical protein